MIGCARIFLSRLKDQVPPPLMAVQKMHQKVMNRRSNFEFYGFLQELCFVREHQQAKSCVPPLGVVYKAEVRTIWL